MAASFHEIGIEFRYKFDDLLHDRGLKLSNGWHVKMGRGLDYFQSLAGNYLQPGAFDLDLRPCLQTNFDFYKEN